MERMVNTNYTEDLPVEMDIFFHSDHVLFRLESCLYIKPGNLQSSTGYFSVVLWSMPKLLSAKYSLSKIDKTNQQEMSLYKKNSKY